LFSAATEASALLLLLAVAMWVRSYRVMDTLHWQRSTKVGDTWRTVHRAIFCTRGDIVVSHFPSQSIRAAGVEPGWKFGFAHATPEDVPAIFAFASGRPEWGFVWARDYYGPASLAIGVPLWLIVLVATPLPAGWAWQARRRLVASRRRAAGLCPICGYDLRATAGRCPECGHAVAPT
jgi:hypothetical protein